MNSKQTNYEFNVLYNKMTGIYHDIIKKFNLSECQFWILYALNVENKPLSQSEISAYLISPKQTIHSSIHKLIENDYISLKETNGIKKYYSLTKKGKQLSKKTVLPVIQIEIETFDTFSERERNQFILMFKKYNEKLDAISKEAL